MPHHLCNFAVLFANRAIFRGLHEVCSQGRAVVPIIRNSSIGTVCLDNTSCGSDGGRLTQSIDAGIPDECSVGFLPRFLVTRPDTGQAPFDGRVVDEPAILLDRISDACLSGSLRPFQEDLLESLLICLEFLCAYAFFCACLMDSTSLLAIGSRNCLSLSGWIVTSWKPTSST